MSTHFLKISFATIPGPFRSTIALPSVKCSFAPAEPGKVVQAAATPKNLTTGIWLLDAFIVGLIHKSRLVSPVILAVPKFERPGRSRDLRNVVWGSIPDLVVDKNRLEYTHPGPASITSTFTSGFSASLPATTFPAVPPPMTIKSYMGEDVSVIVRDTAQRA